MSDAITRLREVMHRLRAPDGCPWDREQTHESLVPNLIEEAYEAVAAIRSGDDVHMEEELGDLLLQVVFHGELGSETGAFDFDSICERITEKLVRRHPHVFGDGEADTAGEVLVQWEQIKAKEKEAQGKPREGAWMEEVGVGFPALLRARELQKKAARVGFDWPDSGGALEKVREELSEVEDARERGEPGALEEELGDLLMAVVNFARKEGFCAEALLAHANEKFVRRFHAMEGRLAQAGKDLQSATLAEMDAAWDAEKESESCEASS